ncbi:hypothetical protein [Proteiniphilum sp.]|uniref:hypothetical protein n=1 Tax=Proteiniphilum sp. TaxID=1926877 RepID=UPI00331CD011
MTAMIIIMVLLLYPLITVIRYGKGVLLPNFARVDRLLTQKTGFHFRGPYSWNSLFGKIVYYLLLSIFLFGISLIIYSLAQ